MERCGTGSPDPSSPLRVERIGENEGTDSAPASLQREVERGSHWRCTLRLTFGRASAHCCTRGTRVRFARHLTCMYTSLLCIAPGTFPSRRSFRASVR
jgi:hypothetical protein